MSKRSADKGYILVIRSGIRVTEYRYDSLKEIEKHLRNEGLNEGESAFILEVTESHKINKQGKLEKIKNESR